MPRSRRKRIRRRGALLPQPRPHSPVSAGRPRTSVRRFCAACMRPLRRAFPPILATSSTQALGVLACSDSRPRWVH
jgi:hypothetical protein